MALLSGKTSPGFAGRFKKLRLAGSPPCFASTAASMREYTLVTSSALSFVLGM